MGIILIIHPILIKHCDYKGIMERESFTISSVPLFYIATYFGPDAGTMRTSLYWVLGLIVMNKIDITPSTIDEFLFKEMYTVVIMSFLLWIKYII